MKMCRYLNDIVCLHTIYEDTDHKMENYVVQNLYGNNTYQDTLNIIRNIIDITVYV